MALYPTQIIGKAGVLPTYAAVALSDTFANPSDERTLLHVKAGATGATVTIPVQRPNIRVPGAGTLVVPALSVVLPANSERMIGPFPDAYTDGAGLVTVNYSAIATVTAAALRMPADSL
jgi:hypothetical protein